MRGVRFQAVVRAVVGFCGIAILGIAAMFISSAAHQKPIDLASLLGALAVAIALGAVGLGLAAWAFAPRSTDN